MIEDLDVFSRSESNVRSYCRSYPVLFDSAQGSYIYDTGGNEYLDFLSGAGALNYGHNEPDICKNIIRYLSRNGIIMSLDKHTQAKKEFIVSMHDYILAPRALEYKLQFTTPSGTSAIESAVKLARKYTGRRNIVAFTNAFHGMTGVSLGLTGCKSSRQTVNSADITRLPYDGYMGKEFNTVDYLVRLLEDNSSGFDLPAAVVLETIQGEGGLNCASNSWLQALAAVCKKYEILLIVDDVQAGCGRTGCFFSFERAQIQPDIICLSKSIGGIGLPLALVLIKPHLDFWQPGEDNGTFRGNNLAFIAGATMMQKYWSENTFQHELTVKELAIRDALLSIGSFYEEHIRQIKGIGCMQGIEFYSPEVAQQLKIDCFKNGLIIECCGDKGQVLKLMPPLTISENELSQGFAIIHLALDQTLTALSGSEAL